ncbi:MAG: helix-turn-helix domain-containing protein [Stenotrophomonas sp.]
MKIKHHSLHGPQVLDLSRQPEDSVHSVVCHGRGTRLLVPAGWISLTLVLTGMLEINNVDAPWQLSGHHIQLWLEGDLRHTSRSYAWWICIAAPAALWESLPSPPTIACHLIPREIRCDRELARAILHMARPRCFNNDRDTTAVTDGMTIVRDVLLERQQSLQGQLSRCSGRTALRRHQTMLRLLRVQHLIRCNMDARLDLNRLAAIANYSPPHLIRVYREVFDETPFEYATRIRLRRAWDLVCNTDLSICDISDSLGFETESAFCRSFKHTFCCTASQARRHNAAFPKNIDSQQQPRLELRAG